jgi:DNA-binding MarR family transcriptional regulator
LISNDGTKLIRIPCHQVGILERALKTESVSMTEHTAPPRLADHVDLLIEGWSHERPDLNVEPLGVVQRVARLATYFAAEIEPVFAQAGLNGSDFAVLANLRRSGAPYQLTQRDLMTSLRLTSGTVSVRIDHLSDRGLVRREPDPEDGRSVLVTLTDLGRELFDTVAPVHLANEDRILAALRPEERGELASLLRILLIEFDQPAEGRPDEELGFRVAPAHVAQERRAAVGLPPAAGLLVESVRPGSWASTAGLTTGDLLVKAGREELRSLNCLAKALSTSPAGVTLIVRRGDRSIALDITPPFLSTGT